MSTTLPPQAAHRKLHDADAQTATLTVGVGWQVRVGERVVWRWQDPAQEVWEVTELLREARPGAVAGCKVIARRAG